jgi:putative peptide zinc metalloprotease protein
MIALETDSFRIEEMERPGSDPQFLLTVSGRPYKVGEFVYLILDGASRQLSYQQISDIINAHQTGTYFSPEDVAEVMEQKLRPMGVFDVPVAETKPADNPLLGGIYARRTLLRYPQYAGVLKVLQYLFSPAFFIVTFVVAASANVYLMKELLALDHYVVNQNIATLATGNCDRGLWHLAVFYPIVFCILMIHELGHAAAGRRFGVKPKEIGAGLYLIFPVLYTDVTEVWRLSKLKRTIVNLGGLYFQLLINLVLIAYLVNHFGQFDHVNTTRYLIQLNVATIVINAIPFLKFDGYWIYSDLFSLPNLRRQSALYLRKVAGMVIPALIRTPKSGDPVISLTNPFLLIYSLGRLLFLMYFFVFAFQTFFGVVLHYPQTVYQFITDFSVCSAEPFIKSSLTVGLFGYFSIGYGRMSRDTIRQTIRKRFNRQ